MIPFCISPGEAARRLPLSYETIRLMCQRGEIEGAKQVKGRWCIPETAPLFQPAPDPDPLPPNATPQECVARFKRIKRDPEKFNRLIRRMA